MPGLVEATSDADQAPAAAAADTAMDDADAWANEQWQGFLAEEAKPTEPVAPGFSMDLPAPNHPRRSGPGGSPLSTLQSGPSVF